MVLVIILGICLGVALAFMITAIMVDSSTNKGDSKASFRDWANKPIKIIEKKDNVNPNNMMNGVNSKKII